MPVAKVHRISATAPDDVGGIEAAIAAGRINPAGIIAIFGKTEGNGLVNDFSRGYIRQRCLGPHDRAPHPATGRREYLPRDVGRHRGGAGTPLGRV